MQFMASRKRRCQSAYLFTVKQCDEESLKAYLSRFNWECMTTDNQDEKITLAALLGRIWLETHLWIELMVLSMPKIPSRL